MMLLLRLKEVADYLGGAADAPPPGLAMPPRSWLWALWWAVLALLVLVFCGQTTKFIYIDF
jgi:hypothetical protein